MGMTYPVLLDDSMVIDLYSMKMAFPTAAFPQDWVIDRQGTVIYANNAYEYDELKGAVEWALSHD
jgi:peroxiredoxin